MYGPLIAMAAGAALISGLVSWAVAVRYGVRWAVGLPLLALLTTLGLVWQSSGMGFHDRIGVVAAAAVFALPALMGAAVGIGVALISAKGRPGRRP